MSTRADIWADGLALEAIVMSHLVAKEYNNNKEAFNLK
jgi:hypothetical protein